MNATTSTTRLHLEKTNDVAWLRRRAVRGGAVLLGSRLAVQSFTWIVTLLVARHLRPLDYGVLTAGGIFMTLGDMFAEAGVGRALVQKHEVTPRDAAAAFTLSLGLALLVYGLLFVIAVPAATYFTNPDVTAYIRVAGLALLTSPFRTVPMALLDRRMMLERQSALFVLLALFQSTVVLTLAASGFGYWALAVGTLLARLLEAVGLATLAGWMPRLCRIGPESIALLRFGMNLSGASLLWFCYSNADYAVVGRIAGPIELGYYSLAFMLVSMPVQKLTTIINQVAYPVYCRLHHDPERIRDWYLRSILLMGFVGLPVLVGMAMVAPDALGVVLGSRWMPAVVPLQCLTIVGSLMMFSTSIVPLCNAMGRPDVNLKYTFVCALVFPIAFCLGAASGGLLGICLAWITLYPIVVAGLFAATRRITGIGPLDLVRAQRPILLALLAMAGSVLVVRRFHPAPEPDLARLINCVGAGTSTYCIIACITARRGLLRDMVRIWAELRPDARRLGK